MRLRSHTNANKALQILERSKLRKMFSSKSRVTNAEATVVQLFSIASSRNRAVYRFRGSFFVTFLEKQKSK